MNNNLIKNIENDRFAKFIGLKIIHIEPDYAKVEMQITDNHLNGMNMVQGGAIFTLADYAFAAAANSNGLITVGINATIAYYKVPTGKVITAEARKIAGQNKICGYNVDILDEDGEIIARFTGMGYIKR
jgi:acyl-CoA thioesterase